MFICLYFSHLCMNEHICLCLFHMFRRCSCPSLFVARFPWPSVLHLVMYSQIRVFHCSFMLFSRTSIFVICFPVSMGHMGPYGPPAYTLKWWANHMYGVPWWADHMYGVPWWANHMYMGPYGPLPYVRCPLVGQPITNETVSPGGPTTQVHMGPT
jgi:hypothetical protein